MDKQFYKKVTDKWALDVNPLFGRKLQSKVFIPSLIFKLYGDERIYKKI